MGKARAGVVGIVVLMALVCAAGAAGDTGFCKARYALDYAAPLREMPGSRPPPEGELPFGPRNVSVYMPDRAAVVLEGSAVGYQIASKNPYARVLRLNWDVRATLRAVDRQGRVKRVVDQRRRRLGTIKGSDDLKFLFPAEHPGFYRVDLRFRRLGGARLGAYRGYFRVLKRNVDVRLVTSGSVFHPGETVYGHVENRGASRITAPVFLDVERYEAGGWVAVEQPVSPNSIRRPNWWLDPGEISGCHGFTIAAATAPGAYRFIVSAYLNELQGRRVRTAPFRVEP
jgi:hypothetical protein